MLNQIAFGIFVLTACCAVVGFFLLMVLMTLYTRTRFDNFFERLPNTPSNNRMLLFSLASFSLFLLEGGMLGALRGDRYSEIFVPVVIGLFLAGICMTRIGKRAGRPLAGRPPASETDSTKETRSNRIFRLCITLLFLAVMLTFVIVQNRTFLF